MIFSYSYPVFGFLLVSGGINVFVFLMSQGGLNQDPNEVRPSQRCAPFAAGLFLSPSPSLPLLSPFFYDSLVVEETGSLV